MTIEIHTALPDEAEVIASMVGELLQEIMAAVEAKVFGFDHGETMARARSWIGDGLYQVLLARSAEEPVGFLALYQSYALYTEGVYGTIPEFYVRPAHRSRGVGAALLAEARRLGQAKGWTRLEVTTPPLPQFERSLLFYERQGFRISGGRKLKLELA